MIVRFPVEQPFLAVEAGGVAGQAYAHHELDPCLEALRRLPCVTELGYCDDRPGWCNIGIFLPLEGGSSSKRMRDENGDDTYMEGNYFSKLYCSRGAFDAYGFKIIRDYHREGERVAWLTESFVKDMQLDPVDPRLTAEQMDWMGVTAIGGIVADFRSGYNRDQASFISLQEDWYESPVAYYKSFAIRTAGPLYFIGATLLIVGFSLLAVWVQTRRVTRLNPAGTLKKE